jgi:hypothetical protein
MVLNSQLTGSLSGCIPYPCCVINSSIPKLVELLTVPKALKPETQAVSQRTNYRSQSSDLKEFHAPI